MDISSISNSLQSALSMVILDQAMGKDAQAIANLVQDMQAATPAPVLSPKAGSMDIRA